MKKRKYKIQKYKIQKYKIQKYKIQKYKIQKYKIQKYNRFFMSLSLPLPSLSTILFLTSTCQGRTKLCHEGTLHKLLQTVRVLDNDQTSTSVLNVFSDSTDTQQQVAKWKVFSVAKKMTEQEEGAGHMAEDWLIQIYVRQLYATNELAGDITMLAVGILADLSSHRQVELERKDIKQLLVLFGEFESNQDCVLELLRLLCNLAADYVNKELLVDFGAVEQIFELVNKTTNLEIDRRATSLLMLLTISERARFLVIKNREMVQEFLVCIL